MSDEVMVPIGYAKTIAAKMVLDFVKEFHEEVRTNENSILNEDKFSLWRYYTAMENEEMQVLNNKDCEGKPGAVNDYEFERLEKKLWKRDMNKLFDKYWKGN